MAEKPDKKIFLIDGSSLYYRAYFALMKNPLFTQSGENTTATYGFVNQLLSLMQKHHPKYLAVVFDTKEPTFRHKRYSEYKATREKMPEEMAAQFPRIVELVKTMGIKVIELPGWEADDVIGTLAKQAAAKGFITYMVTSDKDYMQLVEGNIKMYNPWHKNGPEELGPEEVEEKIGLKPEQIIDYLALMGDSSDNIPGVKKIGPKTALELLKEYSTFENIYENVEKISKKGTRENLITYKEDAILSKELVTIDIDSPVKAEVEELKISLPDKKDLITLLNTLEFTRIIDQLGNVYPDFADKKEEYTAADRNYSLIKNRAQFDNLIKDLESNNFWIFDTETTGLKTLESEVLGISFSINPNEGRYLPLQNLEGISKAEIIEKMKEIFANSAIKKGGQNIKFDILMLNGHGIEVNGVEFDTMIAHYLLHPGSRGHNLNDMARDYLNYEMIPIESLIGKKGKNQRNMAELSPEEVYEYAAEDSDITLQLASILKEELKKENLYLLFRDLEMPMVEVLTAMERNGVKIEVNQMNQMSKKINTRLQDLINEIYDMAGMSFNINSPKQLGAIIYENLKIHEEIGLKRVPKTSKGSFSTAESALEKLSSHPFTGKILEYRKLTKLLNTYVDVMPKLINKKTGRIHASFNQTVTATGRLSSSDPNLQNIPIRAEMGKEIRKAFIPENENSVILAADYSQIELRIMAELSKDEGLRNAFKEGKDIHTSTAALIMKIPHEEVTADHRRKAKEVNFGILYGMNEFGLSNRLNITPQEAKEIITGYFAQFPGVKNYMMQVITFATRKRYVETMMGRRRSIPDIDASNRNIRENAERIAINTTIQGSAADLIKKAMIDIQKYFIKSGLKSKLIIQVHDELVFEVPKDELEEMKKIVNDKMVNAVKLDVSVKVDIGVGPNWLEAHE